MGPIEERVSELMRRAMKRSEPMLEAAVGERDPKAALSLEDIMKVFELQLQAVKQAVLLLARDRQTRRT